MNSRLKEIADEILTHDRIVIVSHVRPDGDTLSCAYAMKEMLKNKGKSVLCVCHERVSERLSFLCDEPILLPGEIPSDFGQTLVLTLDVASTSMLGDCASLLTGVRSIKIDHHNGHDAYADVNYTEEKTAACAEIIYDVAEYWDCMTDKVCDLLYAGISFDTGCFKHSNVTQQTHLKAAYLVSRGVNTNMINKLLFDEKTLSEIEGLKLTYNLLTFFRNGRIALVCIDNELKKQYGLTDDDLADTSQIPIEVKGVMLGITIKEKSGESGVYKISMRSRQGVDASAICNKLNGGGHTCAAGGSIKASSREEAIQKVIAAAGEV